jgi:hypothetical protein
MPKELVAFHVPLMPAGTWATPGGVVGPMNASNNVASDRDLLMIDLFMFPPFLKSIDGMAQPILALAQTGTKRVQHYDLDDQKK